MGSSQPDSGASGASDARGMVAALRAARRSGTPVGPNPYVGAALFDAEGRLHSAGHRRFGGPHAERILLDRLGDSARGRDLYLTLEPCSHQGKTPPCVERVLAAGPRRVVIAALDPNPAVSGGGVAALRRAGIEVRLGVGEREALELNLPFYVAHLRRRAFVELKVAISLDGMTATRSGRSRWITGPQSRAVVHAQRARADAVVVGAGTVAVDDPELTVRDARGPQPSRIVVDSSLRTDPEARLWRAWNRARDGNARADRDGREPAGSGRRIGATGPVERVGNYRFDGSVWVREPRLVLATVRGARARSLETYRRRGWEVWELPGAGGGVSLRALTARACRDGLHHLYVEAGPGLAGALMKQDLVDRLELFQAPIVLGGDRGWAGDLAVDDPGRARRWTGRGSRRHGDDLELRFERAELVERIIEDVHRLGRGNGNRGGRT